MLRKIRITTAIVYLTLVTLLFLDFTGVLHQWFGWLAQIQFLPALLALNVGIVVFLVLLTLLLGRVYCSVICPLGVFQDIVSWIHGKRKKNRFSYSPAISWLRYGMLLVFILAFVLGISAAVSLLEPYSAYGRMASGLLAPLYQWGNNLLAHFSERMGNYAFYPAEVWLKSGITLAIAGVTFIVLAILAWRNGRTYCNTICPAGTVLGFLSRFSFFRPTINTEKCTKCNKCARNCKAACIDIKNERIDYSRCVACMNCLEQCKFDALHYIPRKMGKSKRETTQVDAAAGEPFNARRKFLSISALFALTTALKAQSVDGGLAVIEKKKMPKRATPIMPPGAQSMRHLNIHCTACQLCVSACPNQVIRPSGDLSRLMQPELTFERGYCRPECIKCSEVCPNGAIHRIDTAEKSATQIGHAVWIKENCVVIRDEVICKNCFRHCPTGAIQLVPLHDEQPDSLQIPVVDTERCIGCGACENLCPARPFSAIYVEGHERQRII